ncbi:unnamed protein product [Phytophthora fragariaefolia]|uniref:Unnamed protein product n=1 Tax=Phytophthora fragariaefolia TaxID=1490495 RepID=A0A9W6Y7N7_9STRA|nr:unnamed protein product [Phytophthora fragariaefolia]
MDQIFCAVDGVVFEVDINKRASVSALKKAIKNEKKNKLEKVDADDLQLFLAKKDKGRGAWLTEEEVLSGVSDTADLKLLKSARAEIGDVGLSEDDVRLQVSKEDVVALKGPVHVLVVVPEQYSPLVPTVPVRTRAREESKQEESPVKRHKGIGSKWEWKQEEEPIYCLENDRMFFVNRETATEQLLKIHKNNYTRAVNKGGMTWEIPLVDNIFGLGKSTFGQEYIRRCNQKWDNLSDKREGEFLDLG